MANDCVVVGLAAAAAGAAAGAGAIDAVLAEREKCEQPATAATRMSTRAVRFMVGSSWLSITRATPLQNPPAEVNETRPGRRREPPSAELQQCCGCVMCRDSEDKRGDRHE